MVGQKATIFLGVEGVLAAVAQGIEFYRYQGSFTLMAASRGESRKGWNLRISMRLDAPQADP